MKKQGDKVTRGQGDRGRARACLVSLPPRPLVSLSPRPPVSLSPRPLVSLSPRPLVPLSPPPRRRAFTLAEVLATLVLVGLVLPAVMKGISLALAASDDARRRVEAVGLAENKLAELTADMTTSGTTTGTGAGGGDFGDEAPGYRWESSTTSVDTSLNELRVRVAWTARGRERWVDLSTYAYLSSATSGISTTGGDAGGGGTP